MEEHAPRSPPPPAHDSLVEELLMKRLMGPRSAPQTPPPPPPKPTSKPVRNRRTARPRPKRPAPFQAIRDSFAEKSKAAQRTALALATVQPQRTHSRPGNNAPSPPNAVIKVRHLPPPPPSKTAPTASNNQSSQRAFIVDASSFVEAHRREVGHFGAQALHRRDRKSYQLAQLIKSGCRKPKGQKMPIALLQMQRKREKARALNKKHQDLASGMLLRSKRK